MIRVEVSAQTLVWPRECACCGAAADSSFKAAAEGWGRHPGAPVWGRYAANPSPPGRGEPLVKTRQRAGGEGSRRAAPLDPAPAPAYPDRNG